MILSPAVSPRHHHPLRPSTLVGLRTDLAPTKEREKKNDGESLDNAHTMHKGSVWSAQLEGQHVRGSVRPSGRCIDRILQVFLYKVNKQLSLLTHFKGSSRCSSCSGFAARVAGIDQGRGSG